jgi:hypothetical protein
MNYQAGAGPTLELSYIQLYRLIYLWGRLPAAIAFFVWLFIAAGSRSHNLKIP